MLNLKKLLTKILTALNDMGGLKMKTVTLRNVTIPAGTPSSPTLYEHDFSNEGITGGIWGLAVALNSFMLPYIEYNNTGGHTWVRAVSATKMTIANTGGAWNNYTLYALVIYK